MIIGQGAVAQAHRAHGPDTLAPQDPNDSEGNPIDRSGNGPLPLNLETIDCEWAEWSPSDPCNDNVECGIGTQVIK